MRKKIHHFLHWGRLWLATLVGHVPSHLVRDIFYRSILGIKFPSSTIIYWGARFFGPEGISVGENTIIGDHAFLDGRRGVTIGANVNIASEVRIWTAEHDVNSMTFATSGSPVRIEDHVFIGSRVTVLPGVTIGRGAVIGAGAVVTKDVAEWTIAYGVPAKAAGRRAHVDYTLDTSTRAWFQ